MQQLLLLLNFRTRLEISPMFRNPFRTYSKIIVIIVLLSEMRAQFTFLCRLSVSTNMRPLHARFFFHRVVYHVVERGSESCVSTKTVAKRYLLSALYDVTVIICMPVN